MDQARFDALARALGSGMSRRGALATALAALPAAGALAQGHDDPAAQKKKRKRCRKDSPEGQCCTGKKGCTCNDGGVACGAECCAIGGSCIDGACAATGCGWSSEMRSWQGRLLRGVTADFLELNLFVGIEYEGKVAWATRTGQAAEWVWQPWIGSQGSGPQQNYHVEGLAVAPNGDLYLVDGSKGRVAIWRRNGEGTTWSFVSAFGDQCCGTVRLQDPIGIALTADARTAFVTEQGGVSMYRRSSADLQDWTFMGRLGNAGKGCGLGSFKRPYGVALAASNLALIVSDCDAVQVWTRSDQGSDEWMPSVALETFGAGDRLRNPLGVSVAAFEDRSFFVVDAGGSRVLEWVAQDAAMRQWAVRTIFGSRGKGQGQFMEPIDIHAGIDGTVWVTDIESQQADRRLLTTWSGCRS